MSQEITVTLPVLDQDALPEINELDRTECTLSLEQIQELIDTVVHTVEGRSSDDNVYDLVELTDGMGLTAQQEDRLMG